MGREDINKWLGVGAVAAMAAMVTSVLVSTKNHTPDKPSNLFLAECSNRQFVFGAEKYAWATGGCVNFYTKSGYQPNSVVCGCDIVQVLDPDKAQGEQVPVPRHGGEK